MHGLLRIVLTWLLALALPVQGYAAQAMLFCGPMHDRPAAASSAAGHDHGAHAHGSASLHHDEQAAEPGDGPAQALDGESAGKVSQAKCSVCASCCSMAAIASGHVAPDALRLSFDYALAPFEPHAGRTAGGLDRPPKARLA